MTFIPLLYHSSIMQRQGVRQGREPLDNKNTGDQKITAKKTGGCDLKRTIILHQTCTKTAFSIFKKPCSSMWYWNGPLTDHRDQLMGR